jgi:hypothetical protein
MQATGLFEHPLTDAQRAVEAGAMSAMPLARKVARTRRQ